MVRLTCIYTRTGDQGQTSLGDGSRVGKSTRRIDLIGAVDEANAALGLVRQHDTGNFDTVLLRLQHELFDVGADICFPDLDSTRQAFRITQDFVDRLEQEIDQMNGTLAPLSSFVLPGGTPAAAALHLARTIVRRAERQAAALADEEALNPIVLQYLNRLSDHLFVASRFLNAATGQDVLWVPAASR